MIAGPRISENTSTILNKLTQSHLAMKDQIRVIVMWLNDNTDWGIIGMATGNALLWNEYYKAGIALNCLTALPGFLLFIPTGRKLFTSFLQMNNSRAQNAGISFYEYYHLLNISLDFFMDISSGNLKESAHDDFINHLVQNNMVDEITALVKMEAKLEDFTHCRDYELVKSNALSFALSSTPDDLSEIFNNNIQPYVQNYKLRQLQETELQHQVLPDEENDIRVNRFRCC